MSSRTGRQLQHPSYVNRLRLQNYRSVRKSEIPLSPLTLLVGENSSGKSNIIQAIRLLQQSIRNARSVGDRFPLNGNQLRLGTISDVRNYHSQPEEHVTIGLDLQLPKHSAFPIHPPRIRPRKRLAKISWDMSLGGSIPNEPGSTYLHNVRFVLFGADHQPAVELQLNRKKRDPVARPIFQSFRSGYRYGRYWDFERTYPSTQGAVSRFSGTVRTTGSSHSTHISRAVLHSALPYYLGVQRKAVSVLAEHWVDDLLNANRRPSHRRRPAVGGRQRTDVKEGTPMLSSVDSLIDYSVAQVKKRSATLLQREHTIDHPIELWDPVEYPVLTDSLYEECSVGLKVRKRIVRDVTKRISSNQRVDVIWEDRPWPAIERYSDFVQYLLNTKVRYLGPLREEPRLVMPPSSMAGSRDVGLRGEFTAAVLRSQGNQLLKDVPLPEQEKASTPLAEAVHQWAKHLELVDKVEVEDLAAIGITIKVQPTGGAGNMPLPSVGVGVSQLLPVIALCLLAEAGDIVLLEQPELHLHPALQQRLADFFIAVAQSGRQLIIETHSEYMISRLRRRIAQDKTGELLAMSSIIFAERHRSTGYTEYRRIDVTPYGSIVQWPSGFFDQAAEEEREIIKQALRN